MSEYWVSPESYFDEPLVTLDLFSMDESQWETAKSVSGGDTAHLVRPENAPEAQRISHMVFMWGDPQANEWFRKIMDARLERAATFELCASTVIGDRVWAITPQNQDFDPLEIEIESIQTRHDYVNRTEPAVIEIPYDYQQAEVLLNELLADGNYPLPILVGKLGDRYVNFSIAVNDFEFTSHMQRSDKIRCFYKQEQQRVRQEVVGVYEEWDFNRHTTERNVEFSYEYAALVAENFEYQQKTLRGSNEFNGEELHPALRLLAAYEWNGDVYFSDTMSVKVEPRGDDEIVPAQWDSFTELQNEGLNFEQIMDRIRKHPELLSDYKPEKRYKDDAVVVRLDAGFRGKWGLELTLQENTIAMSVYGESGHTEQASRFMQTYHNKTNVLAEVSANLAMLCAKHSEM